MADDDTVLVEIKPEESKTPQASDKQAPKPGEQVTRRAEASEPDEGIESLKAQIAEMKAREDRERQGRVAAEQLAAQRQAEAQKALGEAQEARDRSAQSDIQTVANAIAASEAEAVAAARELQTALEAGDFAKAGEAQRKISRAEAKLVVLGESKSNLEADKAKHEARRAETRAEPVQDPVEAYIQARTPKTQSWLRQHRECVSDPRMNNRAVAAHHEALADGYQPDTDEYFEFLDQKLGFSVPTGDGEGEPLRTERRSAPAAPVTRVTATKPAGNFVKLTMRERLAADELGLTHSEYARRKQAMMKEGRYAVMSMPSE